LPVAFLFSGVYKAGR